jgi:hypothetical protein
LRLPSFAFEESLPNAWGIVNAACGKLATMRHEGLPVRAA